LFPVEQYHCPVHPPLSTLIQRVGLGGVPDALLQLSPSEVRRLNSELADMLVATVSGVQRRVGAVFDQLGTIGAAATQGAQLSVGVLTFAMVVERLGAVAQRLGVTPWQFLEIEVSSYYSDSLCWPHKSLIERQEE
jgi:hypothetical protein